MDFIGVPVIFKRENSNAAEDVESEQATVPKPAPRKVRIYISVI